MPQINVQKYAENPACATPDGLRAVLLADLKKFTETVDMQRNRLLVATYIRPHVTAGGIIIPQDTQDEDRWQGKVGLVLAVGPVAGDYEEVRELAEASKSKDGMAAKMRAAKKKLGIPTVGDWVAYRASETYEIGVVIGGGTAVSCRVIMDDSVMMRLRDPSLIW